MSVTAKNFYRRPLPETCIDFASAEGKKLFTESLLEGEPSFLNRIYTIDVYSDSILWTKYEKLFPYPYLATRFIFFFCTHCLQTNDFPLIHHTLLMIKSCRLWHGCEAMLLLTVAPFVRGALFIRHAFNRVIEINHEPRIFMGRMLL